MVIGTKNSVCSVTKNWTLLKSRKRGYRKPLFSFLITNIYWNNLKDICVYKKEYSSGFSEPKCFNYDGEEFALTGKYYYKRC